MDTDPILKFLYLLTFAAVFLICWGVYLCWLFDKKTYTNRRTGELELNNLDRTTPSTLYEQQSYEQTVWDLPLHSPSRRHSGTRSQNHSHRNSLASHSHRSSLASPHRLSPLVGPVHLSPFHTSYDFEDAALYSSRRSSDVGLAGIRLDDLPNYDAVSEADQSPPSYSECVAVPPLYSVSLSPSPVLGVKY